MSYQTCMSLFCRTQKKVFWKMLWNSKFFHFSFSLSVDAVSTKDTHEFECIVCQMRKYCLVSQTWKMAKKQQKNCALWSCMKPSNQTEVFEKALAILWARSVRRLRLRLLWVLPVIAIYRPLWNIVPCNQHWWIPDNVSQYLSQWKSRFDCVRRLHHSRGSSFCQTGLGAELWYYFATETHSHVSVLFWKKKASKHDQTKHYFLDLIICFQMAQRCHWAECVRKKY